MPFVVTVVALDDDMVAAASRSDGIGFGVDEKRDDYEKKSCCGGR